MRVVVDPLRWLGNIDQPQHVTGLGHGLLWCEAFVQPERLCYLLTHTQNRVERSHGFLKNHRNLFGSQVAHGLRVCLHQILALKPNLAIGNATGRHGQQLHDGHGCHTFTAARFAHHAQRFTAVDVKVHTIDCMQNAVIGIKMNLKVLNFQQGVGGHPETSLKHTAWIIGIPQTVANVIDGEHRDENQGSRK